MTVGKDTLHKLRRLYAEIWGPWPHDDFSLIQLWLDVRPDGFHFKPMSVRYAETLELMRESHDS